MLAIWFIFSIIVAVIARSKGRSGPGWFVLSLVISPLLACILVLALKAKQEMEAGVPVNSNVDYGSYEGANKLSNPHYRDYLTRRYVVIKNEVLNTFSFDNKTYMDVDSLILAIAKKDGGRIDA
jgi:hypothetical protein